MQHQDKDAPQLLSKEITPLLSQLLSCHSKEEKYHLIMGFGKDLLPFDNSWKIESNLVPGCQSIMYLKTMETEKLLTFYAYSEALISKGLAALMIDVYNNRSPDWIIKNKPTFLEETGIIGILTPGRSNGVLSLYQKMQKEALYFLLYL
jgi:cysteine desulfuration protein SufE